MPWLLSLFRAGCWEDGLVEAHRVGVVLFDLEVGILRRAKKV